MVRSTLYTGPAVTVRFEDHGQDFLEWDIREGRVVNCRPFQKSIWCGLEIHSVPTVGMKLCVEGQNSMLTTIRYPLTHVIKLAATKRIAKPSKAVLNSKVVTRGAKALLADLKKREAT